MESSLNAAHQQCRKAENCARLGKFDAAIEHHQKAASFLQDAMQLTQSEKALESLRLQHDYHIRQEAVTKFKQRQVEKIHKTISQKKKLRETERGDSEQTVLESPGTPADELQCAIYNKMEEFDSLLQVLSRHKNEDEELPIPTLPLITTTSQETSWKTPKDNKVVMEELQTTNHELRRLVHQVVCELEKCQKENQLLRETIERLQQMEDVEDRNMDGESSPAVSMTMADSFIISPCRDLSPVDRVELPPLEMPNFDFNLLKMSVTNINST